MRTQKKLSILLTTIITISFLALIVIISYSFYELGNKQISQKAELSSKLIKESLTIHMVNGIMDKREQFLDKIMKINDIDELWIARSKNIINQYGTGLRNETPKDSLDRTSIHSGKKIKKIYESKDRLKLRFTAPYVASSKGEINCMKCHKAKEGEVLGTVSLIFDITSIKNDSFNVIFYIFIIAISILICVLFILNTSLKPVWDLFNSIMSVIGSANNGDYSKRILTNNKKGESKQVAIWINNFLNKIEKTLENINSNAKEFLISYKSTQSDPLINTQEVISQMADVYRFKKLIETDLDKDMIYERFANVLTKNLGLSDFSFFESDCRTGQLICVYGYNKDVKLDEDTKNKILKTKQSVASDKFEDMLKITNESKTNNYLCIPYTIGEEFDLSIHFTFNNPEMLQNTKKLLPVIENYIDAARPELISKNLTQILRLSSTTDQLTGLYNRKFLDEFIDKATSQTLRSGGKYGVLMLDIDFFKDVNDNYGHDVGDLVIEILAECVLKNIRDADIAFRYGGEEFLIMLFNCDPKSIESIANKIRVTFSDEEIKTSKGDSFYKTVSIGYSSFPSDAKSIWRCIKFADIALYKAKQEGRNRVVQFTSSMLDNKEQATYNEE